MKYASLLLALLLFLSVRAESTPSTIATLRPLHSILAFIMAGVDRPVLLIKEQVSAHDYALRPSERRQLDRVDIIFMVDDTLETFMPSVANNLGLRVTVIRLLQATQINKLHARTPRASRQYPHSDVSIDTHIWLSLENASVIAKIMAEVLAEKDPDNRKTYRHNLLAFQTRANNIRGKNTRAMKGVSLDFVVFHDAYQYLEHSLGLKTSGIVSVDHEIPPGARHLQNIFMILRKQNINCVFYQKPVRLSLLDMLTRQSNATAIELDPLGYDITPGPELYFTMMERLVKQMLSCK